MNPNISGTERILEVKSKFDAEFRRFSLPAVLQAVEFDKLHQLLERLHGLHGIQFIIQYTDPKDNVLLPINNDDNYARALSVCQTIIRIIIQRKGESYGEINGYGAGVKKRGTLGRLMGYPTETRGRPGPQISLQDDFRRVSSIIDVDIVPETLRRVKLMRNGAKPLGFYIRDGVSMRVMTTGIEKVAGIFISRLVKDGLAESTGLLAVNDEVIEVNGIEVRGKSLDQVTDMMVANSSNLIITVKPYNQSTCLASRGGSGKLASGFSSHHASARSGDSLFMSDHKLGAGGASNGGGRGSFRGRLGEDEVRDFSDGLDLNRGSFKPDDEQEGVITL